MKLDLLVASGGVLSHAPRMHQTAMMLIDAFEPEGFTDAREGQHLHDAAPRRARAGAPAGGARGVRARLPDLSRHVRRREGHRQTRQAVLPLYRPVVDAQRVGPDDRGRPPAVSARRRRDGHRDGRARPRLRLSAPVRASRSNARYAAAPSASSSMRAAGRLLLPAERVRQDVRSSTPGSPRCSCIRSSNAKGLRA